MIFVVASRSYISHAPIPLDEPKRVATCRAQLLDALKMPVTDLNLLAGVHGLCYAQVNEEDTLLEFGIRRSAFLNQQAQTTVLLWMVVGITVSGVALAGLQLIAGYRLASAGRAAFEQGGQFSLENNKISLNSSVTGLIILVISLAFFYIFVTQVYLIREVGNARPKSEAGKPDLTWGWGGARAVTPGPGIKPEIPAKSGPLNLGSGGLGVAPQGSPKKPDGKQ